MSKFAHLKKLDVDGTRTAEFHLHALEGSPVLTVRPAMESNKEYFNESLRNSRKNVRTIRNGNLSANMLDETRETDRELYAKHVVMGWKGIKDTRGSAVEFNSADCLDFLKALPDWLFDEMREFCGTPVNFIEQGQVDAETVGKNSKSG